MFEMFELWVSKPGVRLLHGYYRVKSRLDRYILRGHPLYCCYEKLEWVVELYDRPLVWHFEENCKIRELRIWKPRKDLNTVIGINVELFMKSIEHLWFDLRYELYLSMYNVVYICMTCCRWHDRIPSTFRLYLLSIVAHPSPSSPYIYVGPRCI